MPVAFLRENGTSGFAPVARPRFLLGRDLDCDLVDESKDVADHHATVRYRRGEYLVKAEDGCSLWVGGERVPFLPLRDGDTVQLSPGATPWLFRSRVDETFWTPETQVGEAWLAHPAFARSEHGPARFGDGPPIGGRDPHRCRLVFSADGPCIVKHLGPIEDPLEANEHLRLLAAIGGAPHPALATLLDGGLVPHGDQSWRWMATRYVEGECAERLVEAGDASVREVVLILGSLAEALQRLHHRGLVHRAVAPENVVLPSRKHAVLIDFGHAWSAEHEVLMPSDATATATYAAPESAVGTSPVPTPAIDVYGWSATGFALLTGSPPRRRIRAHGVLARVREDQPERWDVNDEVIEALISILVQGLSADPAHRPTAATCHETLAEALAGSGKSS